MAHEFSGMKGSGLYSSNAYIASGYPYITGSTLLSSSFAATNSEVKVIFDKVAKAVTVINTTSSAPILVCFNSITSSNVSGGNHYLTLRNDRDSMTFNVKCKEIYVSLQTGAQNGSFQCYAELTTINQRELGQLSGTGLTV